MLPLGTRCCDGSIILRGRTSAQSYVHAESLLDPSRLPVAVYQQLETSSDPIGRILNREGIAFTRCQLPGLAEGGIRELPISAARELPVC